MAKHTLYVGDNNFVLDELIGQETKVDMIYIDPGFRASNPHLKKYKDEARNWLQNTVANLQKAKVLLKKDGLIFISIGDDKVCDLRFVCDKIFGDENRIAMIAVKTANQTENINVIKNTEYLLIYGASQKSRLHGEEKRQEARCTTGRETQAIHTLIIPKGVRVEGVEDGYYTNDDILKTGGNEDLELVGDPIYVKNGKLHRAIRLRGRWSCPNDVRAWVTKFKSGSKEPVYNKFNKELLELYLLGPRFQPRMIKKGFDKPTTFLDWFTTKGKNQLTDVIGKHDFTYPKDVNFIKYLITLGTGMTDATVLDFYAGSGTTLQAVAELNEEKGSDINAILVTNNENDIAESITIPRIKTLQTGERPDGSVYSDGMDFEFEVVYMDFKQYSFDYPI